MGCWRSGEVEAALEVVHSLHRRHHLRRRLDQRRPIGGGEAGVAQDLQEREPHPRPRVGQQAGPPERVGRVQNRDSSRPQISWQQRPLAHPAHVRHHRRGPGRGYREVARVDPASTKNDPERRQQERTHQAVVEFVKKFEKSSAIAQSSLLI